MFVDATDEKNPAHYECECRFVGKSEYEMLKSIEEIDVSAAIDEYTLELMEEGVL